MIQGSPPRMKIAGLFSVEYPAVNLTAALPKVVRSCSNRATA